MTQYRTKQEIFDISYTGLAKQGFVHSMRDNDICMYTDYDGRHCALGHLMGDNYSPDFEGSCPATVNQFLEYGASVLKACDIELSIEMSQFARELQKMHDQAKDPDNMKEQLHGFAKQHDLTIPHVE